MGTAKLGERRKITDKMAAILRFVAAAVALFSTVDANSDEGAGHRPVPLTDLNFDLEVGETAELLVFFHAHWSRNCDRYMPFYEAAA